MGNKIPAKIAAVSRCSNGRLFSTGLEIVLPVIDSVIVIMILLNEEPVCMNVKQIQRAATRCENFILSLIGRIFGNGESARSATGAAMQYIEINDNA